MQALNSGLKAAMLKYLRLPDDQPLDTLHIFESISEQDLKTEKLSPKSKTRRNWKNNYLESYYENYAKNQGQKILDFNKLKAKVNNTYFLIIDINLPLIQLNISHILEEVSLAAEQ